MPGFARLAATLIFALLLDRPGHLDKQASMGLQSAYKEVIVDQLNQLQAYPHSLPEPAGRMDKRLVAILDRLYTSPSIKLSLSELCIDICHL